MRRIAIVDPSLIDTRGHHYELTRRITESIRINGFQAIWFVNLCSKLKERDEIPILKVFSSSLYDAYIIKKKNLSLFRRILGKIKHAVKINADHNAKEEVMAQQILKGIDAFNLGPDDKLLFHTADAVTYSAIHVLLNEYEIDRIPVIYICTPYDPDGIMPNRVNNVEIADIIRNWKSGGILDRKIYLFAENYRLAYHLGQLWDSNVRELPLPPINISSLDDSCMESINHNIVEKEGVVVISLGPARLEKGFHLLPSIIDSTVKHLEAVQDNQNAKQKKVHFIIQCTPQVVGYNQSVLHTIEKLKTYPDNMVTLIEHNMSENEYICWANAGDIFLLPYGQSEYRYRSSGVVTEAISLGKIIVTTQNTYPGSIVNGNGIVAEDAEGYGKAISDICNDYNTYAEAARQHAHLYNVNNSVDSYIKRCLDAEIQETKH